MFVSIIISVHYYIICIRVKCEIMGIHPLSIIIRPMQALTPTCQLDTGGKAPESPMVRQIACVHSS